MMPKLQKMLTMRITETAEESPSSPICFLVIQKLHRISIFAESFDDVVQLLLIIIKLSETYILGPLSTKWFFSLQLKVYIYYLHKKL